MLKSISCFQARCLARIPMAFAAAGACLIFLMTGCGSSGGFQGQMSSDFGKGNHEVITINGDQTYDQKITCGSGKVLQKSGQWVEAAGQMGSLPGGGSPDGYIMIQDVYDTSTCCTNGSPSLTMDLEPKSMISPNYNPQQSDQETTLGWIIFLRIVVFVYWIWAIVDVCRRDFGATNSKVGWVLCVVLLGCIGAGIYHIFGRSAGEIPLG